ncbi:MAG: hypothetical protein COV72_00700 [Candidatus Omnitrophica bacterium CG11_big_fil_rev_8_21_14_0_20_42_13]|uniref:Uncharacterized protein n=1 Tax=Candidatus Ghiorseimicrobium undicola TaxID=1974746 RepID=A0A2H0LZN2_9BACT|nr:MAG: hypothetical protein COV72_00700 [Candidatus Omnitrophica bacterium CG11_big_fil_rev_8_21_14_0_20_42_13]
MAEISIKEQLSYLVELQEIDLQIYNQKNRFDDIPLQIDKKTKEFESRKSSLKALDDKKNQLLVQKKDAELELASKEENITKLQNQLFQIKTNKEYTAMLKEIEGGKADKSHIEDKILTVMLQLDGFIVEVQKEKENLAQEEKKLAAENAKLKDEQKVIEEALLSLNNKRGQISVKVDAKILKIYDRILKNKEGLALVKVENFACQGCFMNVPPQVVNEIRMHERIVTCEMCSRILYEEAQ